MKRILDAAKNLYYGENLDESIQALEGMLSKNPYNSQRHSALEAAKRLFKVIKSTLDDERAYDNEPQFEIEVGGLGYQVAHAPIDETRSETGEYYGGFLNEDEYGAWGLNYLFTELDKDSQIYQELYRMYEFDEPSYIGVLTIPTTSGIYLYAEKVYVVRCFNNGTTYFTSSNRDALRSFVM